MTEAVKSHPSLPPHPLPRGAVSTLGPSRHGGGQLRVPGQTRGKFNACCDATFTFSPFSLFPFFFPSDLEVKSGHPSLSDM